MVERPADEWLVSELLAITDQVKPPVDVAAILKALEFEVRERAMPEDAMLVRDTGEVFVKRGAPSTRQRFSLGHEIGHFVLGHEIAYARARGLGDRPGERRAADAFAARLLMPDAWVTRAHEQLGANIEALAERFDVSPAAMRLRVRELRLGG